MGNGVMKTPYTSHTTHDKISASATMPYNNPSQDLHAGDGVGMDRMKKMLSSPISRRKGAATAGRPGLEHNAPGRGTDHLTTQGTKYFGIHLEDLVNRERNKVPHLITRVCNYIHRHGITQEGVFRVNGNSRVVEKMKLSFDRTGDADFEETGDVMSVAGLLKLFLRELPEAIIPEITTKQFVSVQEDLVREPELCLQQLTDLLRRLPRVHHDTLKYLVHFLVLVSRQEDVNKMSAVALGIVFGPNIFSIPAVGDRCAGGILGLKEQGITNHIMSKFISEYDRLFLSSGDKSPYVSDSLQDIGQGEGKKVPPPRPPPPKLESALPVPSPRKNKAKRHGMPQYLIDGDSDQADTPRSGKSDGVGTPRFSDDEYLDTYRSQSPIALDSERSESGATMHSPLNTLTTETLNKVITSAVTEHLFGDGSQLSSDDSHASCKNDSSCPVPAPRRKRRERVDESSDTSATDDRSTSDDNRPVNVKDRVRSLDSSEKAVPMRPSGDRQGRRRPNSQAFEMFEKQGIVIGPVPEGGPRPLPDRKRQGHVEVEVDSEDEDTLQDSDRPVPKPRQHGAEIRLHQMNGQDIPESDDSGFGTIHRTADPLLTFKRAPGPKNRRNPTRQVLKRNMSSEEGENEEPLPPDVHAVKENHSQPPLKPRQAFINEAPLNGRQEKYQPASDDDEEEEDVNHNATKPRTDFLRLHHHNGLAEGSTSSPSRSPSLNRKQYSVPPLDLSILHEHGDGSDPILANQGMSLNKAPKVNEAAMLSPRTAKLRKKHSNAHTDTDIPPSPPTQQTHFQKRRDEDYTPQIKQLTKRIQSCKRKLKAFEENFEQERGYRPSQQDKAQRPEMKKVMQELARARKELRKLKEESENDQFSNTTTASVDRVLNSDGSTITPNSDQCRKMQSTLGDLMYKLQDKRLEASRPQDLLLMSYSQVQEEKLAVQKALLHFEGIHGRPSTKSEKELMRPLYDRYRSIKRTLSKPPSPREKSLELQSVPEDHTIEFNCTPSSSNRDPIHVPTGDFDDDDDHDNFMVTRLLKETVRPSPAPSINTSLASVSTVPGERPHSPSSDSTRENEVVRGGKNFHEMSRQQLYDEQHRAKVDKKRLRRVLKDFEDEFYRQTARKVQKEDREPMEPEYHEYKQVKARLKLLEALLSKFDPSSAL